MDTYNNPELLYQGSRVSLLSIEVEHPKGGRMRRELIDHPGAVVIVPLLDPQTVLLIQNYRYVVGQTLWELPAGTLEKDEKPALCAARELEEETGYCASKITPLFEMYSTPGFCNEKLSVFLAEELSYKGQNLDETEQIEVEKIPLIEAFEMIKSGVICDAKTIAALFYLQQARS